MNGRTIGELEVGQVATFAKTITDSDVTLFAGITGDLNPVHIDQGYAEASAFEARIVHGILMAGLISAVLGLQLPGPGAIYVSQSLRFTKPVYLGDTVTARVEVIELMVEKNRVRMKTSCANQRGELVADGESVLMPARA